MCTDDSCLPFPSRLYYVYTVIAVDFRCTFYEIKFGPHAQYSNTGMIIPRKIKIQRNKNGWVVPTNLVIVQSVYAKIPKYVGRVGQGVSPEKDVVQIFAPRAHKT